MTDPRLDDLPDVVRARIVALTAEVLPEVVRLPPALRRVADFAPARRARLGATAIATALAADDDFRDRVATQVASRVTGLAEEPREVAALSWLSRPEGWEGVVRDALRAVLERPEELERDSGEAERLRRKLGEAEQALRDQRALGRARVEELKAENASLRRKLGEARAAVRATRAEIDDTLRGDAEALARAEALAAAQDKELRRLRTQVARGETSATVDRAAERRAVRAGRDEATVRARLLLDTVIEAAAGLQRELGLPSVSGSPADRVETELYDARAAGHVSSRPIGPAQLDQYLSMPRARLVVDGYNVSKSAWPSSSLEAQRIRLLNGLAPFVARSGVESTVVFDAARSSVRPVVSTPRGIKVLFSPEGVIADDVIRDLVDAEPDGRVVVVVTDDQALARDVRLRGARTASASTLVTVIGPG